MSIRLQFHITLVQYIKQQRSQQLSILANKSCFNWVIELYCTLPHPTPTPPTLILWVVLIWSSLGKKIFIEIGHICCFFLAIFRYIFVLSAIHRDLKEDSNLCSKFTPKLVIRVSTVLHTFVIYSFSHSYSPIATVL